MEVVNSTTYFQIEHMNNDYFSVPLTLLFLRDVSQKVRSEKLQRINDQGQAILERMKLSTETLAHDMRAPLASIITIIEILLKS